jgi:hypothetical protein
MHLPDLHWNSEDLKVNRHIIRTILIAVYFKICFFFFVSFPLPLLNNNYFPRIFCSYYGSGDVINLFSNGVAWSDLADSIMHLFQNFVHITAMSFILKGFHICALTGPTFNIVYESIKFYETHKRRNKKCELLQEF